MESLGKRINNANNLCRPAGAQEPGAGVGLGGGVGRGRLGMPECELPTTSCPCDGQQGTGPSQGYAKSAHSCAVPSGLCKVHCASWTLVAANRARQMWNPLLSQPQPQPAPFWHPSPLLLFTFVFICYFLAFWPHPLGTGLPGCVWKPFLSLCRAHIHSWWTWTGAVACLSPWSSP